MQWWYLITCIFWVVPPVESVYIGMPLECHWLPQCALGYHWATQRILVGYTGTPLEKRSWNNPTLECHWRNLVEHTPPPPPPPPTHTHTLGCHWRNSNFCSQHWNTTGGTVTAHTGPDIRLSMQSSIHAGLKWKDGGPPVSMWTGLSLYIQPLLGVYCSAMDTSSTLNTCK